MRPNGGWSSSEIQNIQASIGQYSMQAGEPAHPVQQSVVIARIRGLFLRVALPSPTDIGHSFSTISNTCGSRSCLLDCDVRIAVTLTHPATSLNHLEIWCFA